MNNENSKKYSPRLLLFVLPLGLFAVVIMASFLYEDEDPQAILLAQQKWVHNDLLLNTLERYTKVYQKLESANDRDALAFSYVDKLTSELFLYPPKPGNDKLRVILPDKMDSTIYVLSEIKLNSDLGLYNAYFYVSNQKKGLYQPPPSYSPDTDLLMDYIMTGQQGSADLVISTNKKH